MKQWQSLLENLKRIKTVIDGKYGEIQKLVEYLDRESMLETDLSVKAPSQYVSRDVEEFNLEFIKFNKTMEEMEKSYQDKDLLQLSNKIPDLINFQKFYEKVKYLNHLGEEDLRDLFIYDIYESTLQTAGTSSRAFNNFNTKNHDTFMRLKWNWINNHL